MEDKKKETKKNSSRKLVVEEIESGETEKPAEESSKEVVADSKVVSEDVPTDEKTSEKEKEEDGGSEPETKDETSKKSKPAQISLKQVLMIAVPTAIVVATLTGGILYYLNNSGSIDISPSPTVEPSASPVETAVPEPLFERSEITVQVLNGSGIAGYAGDAKDLLEDLGYVDVDAGNADTYDFTETVVSVKEESQDYLDMVVEDLSEVYVVSEETVTLDETSDFDVVITVGSELQ